MKSEEKERYASFEQLDNREKARFLTNISAIFYMLLILTTLCLWYWNAGCFFPSNIFIGKITLSYQISLGFLFGILVYIMWVCIRNFFSQFKLGEYELKEILGYPTYLQIFIIAIFSGIGEELFFRGFLQPYFGIWFTSLMFGIAHPPLTKNLQLYPLIATFIGFLLGWLFIFTGGILTPIIVHFFINLMNIYRITRLSEDCQCVES